MSVFYGKARIISISLFCFLLTARSRGQSREIITGILDRAVSDFGVQSQEAHIVLEGIGAAYHFPIIVEPDVKGTVTFEVHNATVRTLLDAVCRPNGWSYEIADNGYLLVRRFMTKIYPVDYLQMTQSGTSSASINLSESAGGGVGTSAGGITGAGSPNLGNNTSSNQVGAMSSVSGGSSTLSLSQQNDADFWGHLEVDLKGMIGDGESMVINRFAGVVQLRGSLQTHTIVESYLRRVIQRVGRQARISVKVVEVDLNNQTKAGIDWNVAEASLGRIGNTALSVANATTATGAISQIGSIALAPNTFSGTISAGGVQAVISALAEQGTVRIESKPEISALNNQTAFVQVSEDQPFFSRTSTTTINAGGTTQAGTQPIINTNYSESTVSFGNVLEITVQISDDLITKLSLSPAVTELKGTVTSPDGQETAPITDTKRARTTVTLRNHETAVLGGFITETKADDKRSVPILSNLPVLGSAFTSSAKGSTRTELVFLVTVNAEEPSDIVPVETDSISHSDAEYTPSLDGSHVGRGYKVESIGIDGGSI